MPALHSNLPNIDRDFPKGQCILLGEIQLSELYVLFFDLFKNKHINLIHSFSYLGYTDIHEFFLLSLPVLFDEIIAKNYESQGYICFIEELSSMGLYVEEADLIVNTFEKIIRTFLTQVTIKDETKLFFNVDEDNRLFPIGLISYVNTTPLD